MAIWQIRLGAGHSCVPSHSLLLPNSLAWAHSQGGLRVPRAARGRVLMGKCLSHLCPCYIDRWSLAKPSHVVKPDSRLGGTESASAWEGLQGHRCRERDSLWPLVQPATVSFLLSLLSRMYRPHALPFIWGTHIWWEGDLLHTYTHTGLLPSAPTSPSPQIPLWSAPYLLAL